MPDPEHERLKEASANRGLRLVRSRRRTPGVGDYGRYGLTDAEGKPLLGVGKDGLTATAEEIEAYLHKGLVADWKTSLKETGPAPANPPRRRPPEEAEQERPRPASPPKLRSVPPAEPEPEPEPAPLTVREAMPRDAETMAALIAELGFQASAGDLRRRIAAFRKAGEPPLVAEQGGVIGCLTWHVMPALHRPAPVGRITMMVVAEKERWRGVGRALVEEAAARFAARGCGLIEVTRNIDLGPAHAFYRRLGFERTSYRFARPLR